MAVSQSKKKVTASSKTQEEALSVAKATQRPGQTKEQTRLIAQGIQKGIEQYKKQHKAKIRKLDKQQKKKARAVVAEIDSPEIQADTQYKQHWLPWVLLGASWVGFAAFLFLS
ncbi:DUF2956 domain-containing protein [Sansalvadorimonas verongulae]|uniref:DUF2956 domain-containing protein n=1 Tax=Sansalvadorimonas verongulae TaxID=2172824 RepID=UPI0012BD323E|nr:DUF2956 domain-containing protein [Sansalvadorimonas verongulae]MTI13564.1 DUF2956 domain-containing protein [Sansalvadorimonas verongulae]